MWTTEARRRRRALARRGGGGPLHLSRPKPARGCRSCLSGKLFWSICSNRLPSIPVIVIVNSVRYINHILRIAMGTCDEIPSRILGLGSRNSYWTRAFRVSVLRLLAAAQAGLAVIGTNTRLPFGSLKGAPSCCKRFE